MAYNKELRRFNISQLQFWQFCNLPLQDPWSNHIYMQCYLEVILIVDSLPVA